METRRPALPSDDAHSPSLSILLIDDEVVVDRLLGDFLRKRGHVVRFANAAASALEFFRSGSFDLVISDIRMPGMNGIALIEELKRSDPEIDVILMTGQGDMGSAIAALRAGAADYLLKPLDLQQLQLSIERTARYHALRKEKTAIQARLVRAESTSAGGGMNEDAFIGESASMQHVKSLIGRLASTPDTTALITGESGTGKEVVARLIHRQSARSAHPFVAVNCMAVPRELIENELFGHEKGAFTGADRLQKGVIELAEKGSLFLDEIGDMPLELQGRLLRVLEERSFRRVGGERTIPADVRFIAATNQNLEDLVSRKLFRGDLYFRLRVFTIDVPPLRDRREEIPALIAHFLQRDAARLRKNVRGVERSAMERLLAYHYPGNVRELKNMIERAVILSDADTLAEEHFPPLSPGRVPDGEAGLDFSGQEAAKIRETLANTGGNIGETARLLKLSYDSLRYRMRKLGIDRRP
jgi:DNA-binding NtrC family response regulator